MSNPAPASNWNRTAPIQVNDDVNTGMGDGTGDYTVIDPTRYLWTRVQQPLSAILLVCGLFLGLACGARADTITPKLGMTLPAVGVVGSPCTTTNLSGCYGTKINQNFAILDSTVGYLSSVVAPQFLNIVQSTNGAIIGGNIDSHPNQFGTIARNDAQLELQYPGRALLSIFNSVQPGIPRSDVNGTNYKDEIIGSEYPNAAPFTPRVLTSIESSWYSADPSTGTGMIILNATINGGNTDGQDYVQCGNGGIGLFNSGACPTVASLLYVNGSVGIGTNSPDSRSPFTSVNTGTSAVNSLSGNSMDLRESNPLGSFVLMHFGDKIGTWDSFMAVNASSMNFIGPHQSTPNISITSGGNVGINTTSPQTGLDVSGSAQFGTGAIKSSTTAAGFFRFPVQTKVQIDGLTPGNVGEPVVCSNCTVSNTLCISTGSAVAQYRASYSQTAGCGSNN